GWLLPSDVESWQCTQTLDLRSSAEPRLDDAFFNQVIALPLAGIILLSNSKKNAIYAVHVEYGSYPAATRMDYIAEFSFTMPCGSGVLCSNRGNPTICFGAVSMLTTTDGEYGIR
ncbi:hypothetical protein MKW98_029457, partial [Papaver atlanticum]